MTKKIMLLFFVCFSGSLAFAQGRVLIIGDSHSYGPYGEVLDSHYRKQGLAVSSYASCGSSPSTWVKTSQNFKSTNCGYWSKDSAGKEIRVKSHKLPSMTEALNKSNPQLTVISLGTNILASPANITQELKFVEQMINAVKAKGSECVWIGPPDLSKNPFKANLAAGVSAIKKTVEQKGCKFIDSRSHTKYPTGKSDGIHYGAGDSRKWGTAIVAKLPSLSKQADVPAAKTESSKTQASSGAR